MYIDIDSHRRARYMLYYTRKFLMAVARYELVPDVLGR